MNNNAYKYIITTGWWCTNDNKLDDRKRKYGDSFIRTDEFHKTWFNAVNTFTKPKKIYIIDSNSPVKPLMNQEKEMMISLHNNAGHSTKLIGKLSGVSRAHLLGMSLAMVNEVDYWVYIEQDALIFGNDIIEKCIEKMTKPYMFGSGKGTSQPVQQSLMIIKKEGIPNFIKSFNAIKARDNEISPEMKFAIAASLPLRLVPEVVYKYMGKGTIMSKIVKRIFWPIFSFFKGFDNIPFGYGRARPINFDSRHFYFQHGNKEELNSYFKKINFNKKLPDISV